MNNKINFIIPRQCGKTISFSGLDTQYLALLSDYVKRILNCPIISTDYKKVLLDKFLSIDNSKL